ncbi:MAG: 23S rRNA (uracil(1939)-C(5))-methyltransferase RlmD [Lachnospiraceae bacterium]|nr:23S rRNA (uracil(1939)-C(5))-methyltransferase RlmD [Lachnospiraceae bacterium]
MTNLCPLYGRCGGCRYDGTDYAAELKQKEEKLKSLFTGGKAGEGPLPEAFFASPAFEGIIPSPKEEGYRNKMEFSFGNETKDGPLTLGLHQKGSFFNILPAGCCRIAPPDFRQIVDAVQALFRGMGLTFCHKKSHQGLLRHLVLRRSETDGSLLINLVTQSGFAAQDAFVNCLKALPLEGRIAGILHTENNSLSDAVVPEAVHLLYGEPRLREQVCGLDFQISPFSFFQTNTRAAEKLYEKVREYIAVTPDSLVYDLYSGTGTIAQILAPVAGEVWGVELVEEAVEAARENARMNGLANCHFIAGDVLKKLEELPPEPDYVILDPPRDGVNPKALGRLAGCGAKRIVYVSCKPASLARDLPAFFWAGYHVEKMVFADLFPKTDNCEAVALLSKLEAAKHHIDVTIDMDELDLTSAESKATYEELQKWV